MSKYSLFLVIGVLSLTTLLNLVSVWIVGRAEGNRDTLKTTLLLEHDPKTNKTFSWVTTQPFYIIQNFDKKNEEKVIELSLVSNPCALPFKFGYRLLPEFTLITSTASEGKLFKTNKNKYRLFINADKNDVIFIEVKTLSKNYCDLTNSDPRKVTAKLKSVKNV